MDHESELLVFPLSRECRVRVEVFGEMNADGFRRLIECLNYHKKELVAPPKTGRSQMVDFATRANGETQPTPKFTPNAQPATKIASGPPSKPPKPVGVPSLRPGELEAEIKRRGCKTRTDLHRVRAAEFLLKSGKPMSRSDLCEVCGIPFGSSTLVFSDASLFAELPDNSLVAADGAERVIAKLAPCNRPAPVKAASREPDDPDIELDLNDEHRQRLRELQPHKEQERREGR